MIGFIENPNLPEGKVKAVICGELCRELNEFLDSRDISQITIAPNNNIDPAVRYHTDMAAIHLGRNKILVDKSQNALSDCLKGNGFEIYTTEENIAGEYPKDIKLNFTVFGNKIMGNFVFADDKLLTLTESLSKLDIKQGYCKCSCLVINENALITDDKSIYNIALKNGVDCLLVSKGDVSLPGHNYGFIGGASGKISKTEVLFFGDVTKHRDYKKIAGFIKKHGCKIISLDFPLTDFGGIIPTTEETP